jgi:hypothetical protein
MKKIIKLIAAYRAAIAHLEACRAMYVISRKTVHDAKQKEIEAKKALIAAITALCGQG